MDGACRDDVANKDLVPWPLRCNRHIAAGLKHVDGAVVAADRDIVAIVVVARGRAAHLPRRAAMPIGATQLSRKEGRRGEGGGGHLHYSAL